jgi:hypothetical protein
MGRAHTVGTSDLTDKDIFIEIEIAIIIFLHSITLFERNVAGNTHINQYHALVYSQS